LPGFNFNSLKAYLFLPVSLFNCPLFYKNAADKKYHLLLFCSLRYTSFKKTYLKKGIVKRMITKQTWLDGLRNGVEMTWKLGKIVLPIYVLLTILKYTPVLPWISQALSPVMMYLGLPGEAALPLVMGYSLNLYAGIGAIVALDMTSRQITILAGMLLLCHSLPVETAISARTGVKVRSLLAVRFISSLLGGLLLNLWL
jgi:spore maturation protein SpmB